MPLRIAAAKSELPLYFVSDTQALGRPGVAAYMRALEAISQKNDAAAADYFRQALDQNPANTFSPASLWCSSTSASGNTRRSPISTSGSESPPSKRLPVTLAQIALSFRQSGDADQARSVITAGLGMYPGNATLSALQSRGR